VPLVDGAATGIRNVGSVDWLVGEVLSFRGEATLLEPQELRARVAERARALEGELKQAKAQA
jgi:predicted DNA-binding transcriptional regulator YafY